MTSSTQPDISNSGFARRSNGSCFATETDCGATHAPFRACCPDGSFCPNQYNVNCCPTVSNCTQSLLVNPQCANRTLDLFDNNGYFCCLHGATGGASTTDSDICAEPGYVFNNGERLLSVISSGLIQTSSSAGTSNPPTITPSSVSSSVSSSSTTPSSPPSSHKGAIAGGVVGGIGAIAIIFISIYLFRRRTSRRKNNIHAENTLPIGVVTEKDAAPQGPQAQYMTELSGSATVGGRIEVPGSAGGSELQASTGAPRHLVELSSHRQSTGREQA